VNGMTNPAVTLGAEGQSLESPVLGNEPAGFGGGGGGDDPNGHRALPLSYLTPNATPFLMSSPGTFPLY
jgi:hypothetical protein